MSFKDLGNGHISTPRFGFSPYLFVETHFKRSQHPGTAIFALAALESRRHIAISRDIADEGLEQLVAAAAISAKAHYADNNGKLDLWGDIDYYLLFLTETETVRILPNGIVTSERDLSPTSRSSVRGNPPK
jgi:hypothetical protein